MAKLNGTGGEFEWNGVEIENVKSASLDLSTVAVDSTDNDTGGDKEYLAGDRDGTATVATNYDPAALSAQEDILQDFDSGTARACLWRPTVGVGLKEYQFTGIITSLGVPSNHDAVVEMSLTIQITGGVTVANQT